MASSRQCITLAVAGALALALVACSSKPQTAGRSDDGRGGYKIGKPYTIDGVTYYPAEDMSYSQTGIASWYGPGFHGRNTASGEVYDQDQVSAAHKTLPMPSIVRVTNLDNGRSVVARVNDRGPFVSGRIIDMSKGGARELGLDVTGTARVRVEIMRRESEIVKQVAISGGTVSEQMAALNDPASIKPPAVLDAPPGPTIASAPVVPAAPPTSTVTPVVSASQPIWSPGDPSPRVPMVMASGTASPSSAPPPPSAPVSAPTTTSQVTSAPVAPVYVAPPSQPSPSVAPSTLGGQAAAMAPPGRAPLPATPPPSAPAASPAPSSGGGQIYVQAGAFSQFDNAEKLRQQLAQFGNALVSPVQANGRELYRVRLGPFATIETADALRGRVLQAGYRDARVVSE